MVTVEEAYEFMEYRKSVYDAMIQSYDAQDRANAEAPRLSSNAWNGIGSLIAKGATQQFSEDVEEIVKSMVQQWDHYCATGISVDATETAVAAMQRNLIESFRSVQPESKVEPKKEEEPKKDPRKKGKQQGEGTSKDLQQLADQITQEDETPLSPTEPINEEVVKLVNPSLINMFIDEIAEKVFNERTAFIAMQERFLSDSAKVMEVSTP